MRVRAATSEESSGECRAPRGSPGRSPREEGARRSLGSFVRRKRQTRRTDSPQKLQSDRERLRTTKPPEKPFILADRGLPPPTSARAPQKKTERTRHTHTPHRVPTKRKPGAEARPNGREEEMNGHAEDAEAGPFRLLTREGYACRRKRVKNLCGRFDLSSSFYA